MHLYKPKEGKAQYYETDSYSRTHTLKGQPTLYMVSIRNPNPRKLPLGLHGISRVAYVLPQSTRLYAFADVNDAVNFAGSINRSWVTSTLDPSVGHIENTGNIAILHDDGTISAYDYPKLQPITTEPSQYERKTTTNK